jgi:hypothetical protein
MKTIKAKSYKEIPENFTGIVEWKGGIKEWYKEGIPHREDGPAAEYSDGKKYWYKEGKRHRTDGPAAEYPDGRKEWWLEEKDYYPINLKHHVLLDSYKGKYGIMWYKLLGKDKIFEYPDIPGLITK